MKKQDKWMLIVSILFLVSIALLFIRAVAFPDNVEMDINEIEIVPEIAQNSGQHLVFIMGEDKELENRYYENAIRYYQQHTEGDLITQCRSWECVLEVIQEIHATYQNHFDQIDIVVHGNPWSGLSMNIGEDPKRLKVELLESWNDQLRQFGSTAYMGIEEETKVNIHACGLGENEQLIHAFEDNIHLVSGKKLEVKSTDAFRNYVLDENGIAEERSMDVYYAFYPTAYKPADLHLARQLSKSYPNDDLNWINGIQADKNGSPEGLYNYKFNIPIEWEVLYPEYDVPELSDEFDKLEWIMNQSELMEIVEKLDIPFDYFRWIVKKGNKMDEDYGEVPYIKVFGKVTVLCILKEINPMELKA